MDGMWSKVIKITGAVGVVGFLIYIVLINIFSKDIATMFGSDRLFALTVGTISVLFIILLVSILNAKEKSKLSHKKKSKPTVKSNGPKVTYQDRSTHNGDNNF